MKNKCVVLIALIIGIVAQLQAQLVSTNHTIVGTAVKAPTYKSSMKRSALKPTKCAGDTVSFTRQGSTAFNTVTISNGRSLGQFFSVPQTMKVSGFTFYCFAITPTPVRNVTINVRCNLYMAGLDSLPSGNPIASDTIAVDTVVGNNILLSRIERRASFAGVTLNGNYVLVVECDSTNLSAAIVTNSWTAKNGKGRNLGCGSINNVWYRCLNLNVSGVTFDCDMQYYPYVQYDFGTNFTVQNPCYTIGDTVRFTNQSSSNVAGSEIYNYYKYANFERFCHLWRYSPSYAEYIVHGKYKYPSATNEMVSLESRVYQWSTGNFCYDTQRVEVNFKPNAPTMSSDLKACKGDTLQLKIGNWDNISKTFWYKQTGVTPVDSGVAIVINNIQKDDSFYIRNINKKCVSNYLKRNIKVYDYPGALTVKNDSICIGAVANLGAYTSLGEVFWYKNINDTKEIYTGTDYQTNTLTADTHFFVEANNKGCVNIGSRQIVTASVSNDFAPDLPITSADTTVCSPYNFIKLTATGSNTLRWYNTGIGGTPIQTGAEYIINPQDKGKYKYYVENWNGVCGSGRKEINVEVNKAVLLDALAAKTICVGDSVLLEQNVSYGNVNWFLSSSQTTPTATGKQFWVVGLSNTQKVYFRHTDGDCEYAGTQNVDVIVNSAPIPSLVSAPAVCFKGKGLFTVNVPTGNVNWFETLDDSAAFSTSSTVQVPIVLGNVSYYYQTEDKGCKSEKTLITLVSKPRPVAGFTYSLVWQNKFKGTPVNTANASFFWDFGDGQTATTPTVLHPYSSAGVYTITQIATHTGNGCKDTVSIPVNISHLHAAEVQKQAVWLYPNPVASGGIVQIFGLANYTILRVLDLNGKTVAEGNGSQGINTSALTAGVYIVQATAANQNYLIKLIVQ